MEKRRVTLRSVIEVVKTNSIKPIATMVLECGSCGHKDFLIKFVERVKSGILFGSTAWKPTARPLTPTWSFGAEERVWGACRLKEGSFKPLFYCPKCGSSYVLVDEKELLKYAI